MQNLLTPRIDVDKPLYDLSTFAGRFRHFAWMTDPRTVIVSSDKLMQAKQFVENYRQGKEPAGTTSEKVKYAMKLYNSAFHPDTGELQNFCGRMSFQVSIINLYTYVHIHIVYKHTYLGNYLITTIIANESFVK
ncbi:sideroflexin-2-like [Lucilia cuprina]|uniref:sideroflexin-2-like n=1 Tax=Lucilia cuprina TaxID=7375 RepID=UPI001F069871|nr:sideroflexin-2-like [Lucilia cuprina]XP_046808116.1 sideroflexin-2-like [Lucilia cuprina]XP_046808117.1 sideroflexin-2-like [Lucilia cuprina]